MRLRDRNLARPLGSRLHFSPRRQAIVDLAVGPSCIFAGNAYQPRPKPSAACRGSTPVTTRSRETDVLQKPNVATRIDHRFNAGFMRRSDLERAVGRLLRRRKPGNSKSLPTPLRVPEVVLRLLGEPTLGGRAEGTGKTDRHLRADPGTVVQNGGQGLAAHSKRFGGLRDRDAEWLEAQRLDDLARMRWIVHSHRSDPLAFGKLRGLASRRRRRARRERHDTTS